MKKLALVLIPATISTVCLTLWAQQTTSLPRPRVRTHLSFVPFDPIGQKLKDQVLDRLAQSNVISLLPDSPDSWTNARFLIRVHSEAIGVHEQQCEPLSIGQSDKATATAVAFIYETNCGPGRTRGAGDGLVVCTKNDVASCVDKIVRAAENNASVVEQSCSPSRWP